MVGLIGSASVGKTCAFLGNDYDKILGMKRGHQTPPNLKTHLREEIIKLIENEDVDTFLVGEIGGYEVDGFGSSKGISGHTHLFGNFTDDRPARNGGM